MSKSIRNFIVISLLLIVFFEMNKSQEQVLIVYAGAGLKAPLEEIGQMYKVEKDVDIKYNFAGCGQHISQMANTDQCDIFIGGSTYYANIAKEKGYIDTYISLVKHIPAIATSKDLEVNSIDELFRGNYILGQGDESATAIGKVAKKVFNNMDLNYKKSVVKKVVYTPTANQLLVYLENGNTDFSIIWEDMTINSDKYNTYTIPKKYNVIKEVPIAVTNSTKTPEIAQDFLDYLTSEKGINTFEKYGFKRCEK